MAPPTPRAFGPGLMAIAARPGRGLMTPHPDAVAPDWPRDGVAYLWLVALILAFVVSVALLEHAPA